MAVDPADPKTRTLIIQYNEAGDIAFDFRGRHVYEAFGVLTHLYNLILGMLPDGEDGDE